MDLTALFKMSYGLYVVCADDGAQRAGCIVNTATQVTADPVQIMVAVHKDNVTTGVIERAGAFSVTVVDRTADMPYIGNFGFRSSATYDKFETYETRVSEVGAPYCPEHACAHMLFIGEAEQAERLADTEPLTYAAYHSELKGKTPPKASSYQG